MVHINQLKAGYDELSAPKRSVARVFPSSERVQYSQDLHKNLSLRRIESGVRAKHAGSGNLADRRKWAESTESATSSSNGRAFELLIQQLGIFKLLFRNNE